MLGYEIIVGSLILCPLTASCNFNHSSVDSFLYMCKGTVNKEDEKGVN